MNYTEFAIDDIFSKKIEENLITPFLKGVYKSTGEIETFKDGRKYVTFVSHYINAILEISLYFKKKYNESLTINYQTENQIKKIFFTGILEGKTVYNFLADIEIAIFDNKSKTFKLINQKPLVDESEIIAFLKGIFAISGNIYFPDIEEQSNYHLEFILQDMKTVNEVQKYLSNYNITIKLKEKEDEYIRVYIKDSEKISDFFALIGANDTVVKLNEMIVNKSYRNQLNRQNNCFIGNLKKSIKASEEQILSIKYINENNPTLLDQKLKIVADCRLNNPEFSLDEMSRDLNLSKSCVRHRLDKIKQTANDLKESLQNGK